MKTIHTLRTSAAAEVISAVTTSSAKLQPLLPPGYTVLPAVAFGVGTADQGVVAIASYRGYGLAINGGSLRRSLRWLLMWVS